MVLIIIFVFRKAITGLLGRVSSYEGLGQVVTFGDKLAKVENEVDVLAVDLPAEEEISDTPEDTSASDWLGGPKRGILPPHPLSLYGGPGSVIQGWNAVEDALGRLASAVNVESRGERVSTASDFLRRRSPGEIVGLLTAKGVIPNLLGSVLDDLRMLRNRVAHGRYTPTDGEAITYFQRSAEVADVINRLADIAEGKIGEGGG
ncbi:hypothetical protein [Streptosporangium sp. NPDC020145]|uniref:hypothetical protein n=1 Tax=Streptosporangium sp. NPDC020145 TaxID=3154694 RepID=UPI00341CC8C8